MTVTVTDDLLNAYPLKAGAGGLIAGLAIHPTSGRIISKPDVFNAYIRDTADTAWRPMLKTTNLPASVLARERQYQGWVLSVDIAETDQDCMVLDASGYVLRTLNGGTTFTETAFPAQLTPGQASNNGERRMYNRRLVIDPSDKNTIYRGHYEPALQVSFDGGATVTTPASFPAPTSSGQNDSGVCGICIDKSSALTSGRRSRVVANSRGNGWYISTDGGSTWSAIAGSDTGSITGAAMNSQGDLFVCNKTTTVRKYTKASGTWSTLTGVTVAAFTIAIDPADDNRMLISNIGSPAPQFQQTADGGGTWGTAFSAARDLNGEVYWIGVANPSAFTTAHILFDPLVANRVWVADGLSVLRGTIAPGATSVTFSDYSNGIEELVGHGVRKPPGSNQIHVVTHDRCGIPKGNPDRNARDYLFRTKMEAARPGIFINHGFHLEYSEANPRIRVQSSSYFDRVSNDGGDSWLDLPSPPWLRTKQTVTNRFSTQAGSPLVTYTHSIGHGNDTSVTSKFEIIGPLSIGGLTLNGVYDCTYPNANDIQINAGSNAGSAVTLGGGTVDIRFGWGDLFAAGERINFGPTVKRYVPFDENRIIAEGGNGTGIWYTANRGQSWTKLVWPDGSIDENFSNLDGVGNIRMIVAIDYTAPGTAIFLAGTGVFRTTDYCATITKVKTGAVDGYSLFSNRARFARGVAGTCFFTGGAVTGINPGSPTNNFSISRDTGATWTPVSDVLEVWAFGYGPVVAPSTVPALGLVGWLNGNTYANFGVYVCLDWSNPNSALWQWKRVHAGEPMGNFDYNSYLEMDPENWRKIYGTFAGSGYWYLADQKLEDGPKSFLCKAA